MDVSKRNTASRFHTSRTIVSHTPRRKQAQHSPSQQRSDLVRGMRRPTRFGNLHARHIRQQRVHHRAQTKAHNTQQREAEMSGYPRHLLDPGRGRERRRRVHRLRRGRRRDGVSDGVGDAGFGGGFLVRLDYFGAELVVWSHGEEGHV